MSGPSTPGISVLMSVYNGETYIARAIVSLLVQTYENFELILIDDGSSDNTAHIVKQIKDDRIRFFQQENLGLTITLNKALALSKGRYIARHDADDFSICSRFEKQMNFLQKNSQIGLLGSSCFIQPEKHSIINEVYDYPSTQEDIIQAFKTYNPFVHGSMMIRRELLEACGGYNENYRYVQDYELWSRLLPKTQVHNLSEPLYVRSVHPQASQVNVDKSPIFDEIRTDYLLNNPQKQNCETRQILSKSLYPMVTRTGGWNRSIGATFSRMALESKKHGLPWFGLIGQAFMYSPFRLGSKHV